MTRKCSASNKKDREQKSASVSLRELVEGKQTTRALPVVGQSGRKFSNSDQEPRILGFAVFERDRDVLVRFFPVSELTQRDMKAAFLSCRELLEAGLSIREVRVGRRLPRIQQATSVTERKYKEATFPNPIYDIYSPPAPDGVDFFDTKETREKLENGS